MNQQVIGLDFAQPPSQQPLEKNTMWKSLIRRATFGAQKSTPDADRMRSDIARSNCTLKMDDRQITSAMLQDDTIGLQLPQMLCSFCNFRASRNWCSSRLFWMLSTVSSQEDIDCDFPVRLRLECSSSQRSKSGFDTCSCTGRTVPIDASNYRI